MIDFDTLQKLPNNVGNLDKLIVAKGFKMLPKVQKIAKSGHTAVVLNLLQECLCAARGKNMS